MDYLDVLRWSIVLISFIAWIVSKRVKNNMPWLALMCVAYGAFLGVEFSQGLWEGIKFLLVLAILRVVSAIGRAFPDD